MKLNEAKLLYNNIFVTYLKQIKNGIDCLEKEAAAILYKLEYEEFSPLVGTSIQMTEDGNIEYYRVFKDKDGIEQLKIQKAGAQRFLTQLFKDIGKPQNQNIIDALSRRLKSFVLVDKVQVKLIVGTGIPWCYLVGNTLNTGSLNTSCMRHDDTQNFLELYKINPDRIALLTVFKGETVAARRLIWKTDNDTFTFDRIYSASDEYTNIITDFTLNKDKRLNIIQPDTKVMNSEDISNLEEWKDYISQDWDKPNNKDRITLTNIPEYMPYIDTYYTADINKYKIILSTSNGCYTAQTQCGMIIENCYECDGSGYEVCTNCKGSGKVKCEECEGTNECDTCGGSGESDEIDEDENAIECDTCGGSGACNSCEDGENDCSDCYKSDVIGCVPCYCCGGGGTVQLSISDI
jgi:hypothetical protein